MRSGISPRIAWALVMALVVIGVYLVAYLVWRHMHTVTFEEYQSLEPGQVAVGHEGERIMYVPLREDASGPALTGAMIVFYPVLYLDERYFGLVLASE